jgi:anti-repressor protein
MSEEIVPQVFENSEFGKLRVTQDESGEPWFVAKDVCDALGLDTSHVRRGLDDDEVTTLPNWQGKGAAPLIVSEAGLYSLVLKSRKPEAKRFRRWVTHDVLPAIRRDGGYMVAREDESDDVVMARALLIADKALKRKDKLIAEQGAQIDEMRPKALFADAVAASDGTCLVGELAKMMTQAGFTVGQNRLFAILRNDGYLGKSGGNRNVPLQRYIEQGLFKIKETAVSHADGHVTINRTPKITGRGQRYFIDHYCKQERMD